MSARIESLLDELNHLRIQISLAADTTVPDDARLCALQLRLLQLEGRLHEEQKNPNSWKVGDNPRI